MLFSYSGLGLAMLSLVLGTPLETRDEVPAVVSQQQAAQPVDAQQQGQDQVQGQPQPVGEAPQVEAQPAAPIADYTGGEAIYYLQDRQYGSCMEVHEDTELVVALSYKLQGDYFPQPHCGKNLEINNTGGGVDNQGLGNKFNARVVDTCTCCDKADLEMSVGLFLQLKGGALDPDGNFTVGWRFV